MAKTRKNEKKKVPKVYKKVYPFLLLLATLFMGIGYAKVADINLDINGQALALEQEGIIITSVSLLEVGQNGVGSVVGFNDTLLNTNITLANSADSSVTFEVSIGNNSTDGLTHYFTGVTPDGYDADFYPNRYITYELDGLEVGDALAYKDEVTFTITFKYTSNVNFNATDFSNTLLSYLSFNFYGVSMDQPGGYEYVIPMTGYYSLDVWGAAGYSYSDEYHGGYGAYSTGDVYLEKGTTLYVHTGGTGTGGLGYTDGNNYAKYPGGYNGGAQGRNPSETVYAGGGGGATHIAFTDGLLNSFANNIDDILIIAGGGGSVYYEPDTLIITGGNGGGNAGTGGSILLGNAVLSTGGTQTAAGLSASSATPGGPLGWDGKFGQATDYNSQNGVGAGGGFYGGGSAWTSSAGGGSGYIGNVNLVNKYMATYIGDGTEDNTLSEEENTKTIGTTSYSNNPVVDYAKSGDGYAKITYIGEELDAPDDPVVTDEYVTIFGTQFKVINAVPTLTNSSNNTTDESGLYKSTDTNSGNPTYYFRGDVTNNYVSFLGYTWRVVRVNEDGTIRIVMNTGYNNNAVYAFNGNTNSYNYMYYTNSNIMQTLTNLYNGLSNADKNKIAPGDYFCEQAKVKSEAGWTSGNADMTVFDVYSENYYDEGVDSNHKPSFTCEDDGNGYGIVSASIGLLTYDEVLFAGGYRNTGNENYYLYNGYASWLMSPAGVNGNNAQAWRIDDDAINGGIDGGIGAGRVSYTQSRTLRPVINIKADVAVKGTGEALTPWVIQ